MLPNRNYSLLWTQFPDFLPHLLFPMSCTATTSVELHYHHIQKRQRKEKDEDKLKTLKKYKYVMFPAKNGMDCTTIYNPPFVEY